jgi:hypothetical protein
MAPQCTDVMLALLALLQNVVDLCAPPKYVSHAKKQQKPLLEERKVSTWLYRVWPVALRTFIG